MKRWLLAACTGLALVQAAPLVAQPSAVSADGRWELRAEAGALAVIDRSTSQRLKTLPARALDGSGPSAVAQIHFLVARRSFVVSFVTLAEWWEVSTDPQAAPVYDGLVHDYRMGEGLAIPGFLNPRRTQLETPLRGLSFDRTQAYVLGRAANRPDGRAVLQVWQLDVRRRIAEHVAEAGADPDTSQARLMLLGSREVFSVPDRAGGPALLVDWRRP